MLLHQIKFSLFNMAGRPESDKAYEAEQFQDALQEIIDEQKQPITSARIDDVNVNGGYDSTVKTAAVAYENDVGKLVIEFTDGTTSAVGFDNTDIIIAHIYNEMLIIDTHCPVPMFKEA